MILRNLAVAAGLSIVGVGYYATQVEPYRVEYVHHKLPIPHLPRGLQGAKLIHISDMHTGYRVPNRYLFRVFEEIVALEPEFVVYTGDFITQERTTEIHNLEPVMQVAPHGSLGTVAVLGNHDYGKYTRQPEVASLIVETLNRFDIPILRNAQLTLNGITFTGLDDLRGPNFAPEEIVKSIDHSRANIVLCHNPDVADMPMWDGFESWILSGHTHGGQVRLPFMRPPLLPIRNKLYSDGPFDLANGHHLYVNRGVGHLTRLRLNVRPEITIHTLEMG